MLVEFDVIKEHHKNKIFYDLSNISTQQGFDIVNMWRIFNKELKEVEKVFKNTINIEFKNYLIGKIEVLEEVLEYIESAYK